jgi:hypothetical protein
MNGSFLQRLLEGALWVSVVATLYLTFAWPFLHSSDPADAAFKVAAIGAFAAFFASLAALIAQRACRAPRT